MNNKQIIPFFYSKKNLLSNFQDLLQVMFTTVYITGLILPVRGIFMPNL
jgi:hypothetical protein